MKNRLIWIGLMALFVALLFYATAYQSKPVSRAHVAAFLAEPGTWADDQLQRLDTRQRLAQMLLIVQEPGPDDTVVFVGERELGFTPGGYVFAGVRVHEQYDLTARYQQEARIPLLIGTDQQEAVRVRIPQGYELAAIRSDSLLGAAVRGQVQEWRDRRIHLVLLALGDSLYPSETVSALTAHIATMGAALADARMLGCATDIQPFFPSEYDTAQLRRRVEPYKQLIRQGLPALMPRASAFAAVRVAEPQNSIMQRYLETHIAYQGLLLATLPADEQTDKQVRKRIKAGADLLIVRPEQAAEALRTLENMAASRELGPDEVANKTWRVLLAKSWCGAPADAGAAATDTLLTFTNQRPAWLNRCIREASLAVVQNEQQHIPVTRLGDKAVHLLALDRDYDPMLSQMRAYGPVSHSALRSEPGKPLPPLRVRNLREFRPVVLAMCDVRLDTARDQTFFASLRELMAAVPVIAVNYGPPDALRAWPADLPVLQAYGADTLSQELAAQLLLGGIAAGGRFPMTVREGLRLGDGDRTPVIRLAYTLPEAAAMSALVLQRIDSVVYEGIYNYAMPGCQVLVARRGRVIYHKAFGYHTYTRQRGVYTTDLYDIASVTKVAATTVATMKLASEGRLQVESPLRRFFRNLAVEFDTLVVRDTVYLALRPVGGDTLVADTAAPEVLRKVPPTRVDTVPVGEDSLMIVRTWSAGRVSKEARWADEPLAALLTHTSGMPAGLSILPFIKQRRCSRGEYGRFYSPRQDSLTQWQVAEGLHLRRVAWDSLWRDTKRIYVTPDKDYRYSDANMILVQLAIDSLTGMPIDSFVRTRIYTPLGMQNTCYTPLRYVEPERIVPTEYDGRWRCQLLRGYVHDPTAALMGGVAGNAGVFSTAGDLAHLFQMLLNGGAYGGEDILSPSVVADFTRAHRGHRGYGFDKPPRDGPYIISQYASSASYGHTGYTGTCVWVDPEEELVFIFLSNRVHPSSNNWKINDLQIRQRIHDVVYEAIRQGEIPSMLAQGAVDSAGRR
ncbi:MAG: hypothetical protein OHK0039_02020 [Bacteroidia bacterium]